MSMSFTEVIARCLAHTSGKTPDQIVPLVDRVLDSKPPSSREVLNLLQRDITAALGANDRIDLVYGGATKIKGYVFEAARLPEIRGASALLDWAGEHEVERIWREALGEELGRACIIYAGGGNFLAFAPAGMGAGLATAVERAYTAATLTAQSVAVSATFRLLELRYGRLAFDEQGQVSWWVKEFLEAWKDDNLKRQLAAYYWGNEQKDKPEDRFYRRKTFGELVTVLTTMYHRRRDERQAHGETHRRRDERQAHGETRSLPLVQRLPWMARCASSDHRPAVLADEVYGALSEASARKLAAGRLVKRGEPESIQRISKVIGWKPPQALEDKSWESCWRAHLTSDTKGRASPYAEQYRELEERGKQVQPARDTHQIGTAGNGYIGLIYADGNNVGRLMAGLRTPQDYRRASERLSKAATQAVFAALAERLEPAYGRDEQGRADWFHPFEILTIGGDDLLLIVPGSRAFDIALDIGYHFEYGLRLQEQGGREDGGRYRGSDARATRFNSYTPEIGLSAGLVIARADAPIFFLRDLVEELLKSAKQLARRGDGGGALDFMVMKSITMVTDKIKTFRAAALEGAQCRLTARPYTWPELAGLLATLRALKQAAVPRSQLYRLRGVLEQARDQGPLASTMEYLYTRTRQGEPVARALYKAIEHDWRDTLSTPPWMPRARVKENEPPWETIWADLVEIYDMVEEKQKEQAHAAAAD